MHSFCGKECKATREICRMAPIEVPTFCNLQPPVGLSLCECGKVTGSKQVKTTADLLYLLPLCGPKTDKCKMCVPSQEEQTESVATDHKDKKALNTVSPSQPRMQPEHNVVAPTRSEDVKQCKYFNAGCCRFGDKCHNLHDVAQSQPQRRVAVRVPITATPNHNGKKEPCQNFSAWGSCTYGIRCRFSHDASQLQSPAIGSIVRKGQIYVRVRPVQQ